MTDEQAREAAATALRIVQHHPFEVVADDTLPEGEVRVYVGGVCVARVVNCGLTEDGRMVGDLAPAETA